MLIMRIELENIKSYRHVVIDFRRGTTAISGANGAGKTTLVEAIGFALFGYLPYSQDQFVREGEKHGKVVVRLQGSDDRPYTVERRCGTGSRWLIYDEEADLRLEQRADVQDKLHDLFGIDRERPLDSLFRDALGVPQGTFTAIFLDPAGKRKQTFDALLQIEDYKLAADNLLETQKYYQGQKQVQELEVQRLSLATSELELWRLQIKAARMQDEQQKTQNVQLSQLLTRQEARFTVLNDQLMLLNKLEQQFTTIQQDHLHAQHLLVDREQQLQVARSAQDRVQASQSDYQRYQQVQERLKQLRHDAQQRDTLRQQQARLKNEQGKIETKIQGWQERLEEVNAARQRVNELARVVERQVELEKNREEAGQHATQYKTISAEIQRLHAQLVKCQQEQVNQQQRIVEIEPLMVLAELLPERSETYTQLRIKASERSKTRLQLQEKRELLRERQLDRDQIAERLRKAENNVALIEEHRQEAEEMPQLQERYEQLAAQKHRLEGNIEAYIDSRAQSAGGQCPLLHESCLNIKQRGIVSLESYFDNLLQVENEQVSEISQQQTSITNQMGQIKKYADALAKLGQYIERREILAEQLQRHAVEITRLQREVTALTEELDAIKLVEQQMGLAETAFNESKQADAHVRELAGLYKQVQHLQAQSQQLSTDLQQRSLEADPLRNSEAQCKLLDIELANLNDPRSDHKAQQAIVEQEGHRCQQLELAQQQQQQVLQNIQYLDEQLVLYATVDEEIGRLEVEGQQRAKGYQSYLQNEREACRLPEHEQAYRQQMQAKESILQQLQSVEQAYTAARDVFNLQELVDLRVQLESVRNDLASLAVHMQHHQEYMSQLEQQIVKAERLVFELETAQQEHQMLEELQTMTEQFRKLIKEAAPHVLKAILSDISAESNRIFGEVMGDKSAQLSWKNDYEIVLRRQGVDRSFAQLSGGEQMSAALAVRLALLKKLSTLNIAFFDEPTQNMDEMRRMNLAEQIRRVRGFDQLIVISHDDTFEQGLDSLVRLNKVSGETRLLDDAASSENDLSETVGRPFSAASVLL